MPAIHRKLATRHQPSEISGRERRREVSAVAARCLLAVLLFATVTLIIFAIQKDGAPVEQAASPVASSSATAEPFVDGQIRFLVESIKPLGASPGMDTGEVHVVVVELKNTGLSPQLVSFDDQRLLGDQGREWSPDAELLKQLNGGKRAVLLPPGGEATMRIPFALPVDTEPVAVVLKAGPELSGVPVPSR